MLNVIVMGALARCKAVGRVMDECMDWRRQDAILVSGGKSAGNGTPYS
jgi:hypothetical protein